MIDRWKIFEAQFGRTVRESDAAWCRGLSPTERAEIVEDLYATARLVTKAPPTGPPSRISPGGEHSPTGSDSWRSSIRWRQHVDARLWPTLADAIAMLDGRGIRCAVIGGLAVSLRGLPRMTVDVDLVIQSGIDDCLRMARDLTASPFMPLFEGVEEVVSSAFILPVRHRVTGVRVDLAIGMSGFERDSISRATPVMVGSETIPVVSVEDLLVMKAVAGRPQDDSDIRGLIDVQRDSIDWDHCLGTARALGAAIDVDIAGRLEAARRM